LPQHSSHEAPLEELAGLVETAGAVIAGKLTQKRQAPNAASGKAIDDAGQLKMPLVELELAVDQGIDLDPLNLRA
jgi:50S ribosomal subunit-associated GTPase HflX